MLGVRRCYMPGYEGCLGVRGYADGARVCRVYIIIRVRIILKTCYFVNCFIVFLFCYIQLYVKQQEEIAHIKAFIATCGTYANLVRQAKSRQKV